jgi:hypothetical protein
MLTFMYIFELNDDTLSTFFLIFLQLYTLVIVFQKN